MGQRVLLLERKLGTGEAGGLPLEEATYEGYGPGGVAVLVEVATDNRNRTAGDVRNIFVRHGGALAEAGAVSYLFRHAGLIVIERAAAAEDAVFEAALDAGADDVQSGGEAYEITTPVAAFEAAGDPETARAILERLAESAELRGYVRFAGIYRRELQALDAADRD